MAQMAVFDLLRTAKYIAVVIWGGIAASIIFAFLFPHEWWAWMPLTVFGPLAVGDLYCRFLQKGHAILRNFGLFGAMRYLMESVGPELRQYWIANDTEEKPFSRRERAEVYRYAKNEKIQTAAFGTQLKEIEKGTIRHSMFPLEAKDLTPYRLTFGEENDCPNPFTITKPFMISAMSFGSLGEHAVRALARGARRAGIAMNTGEGGTPKYHLMESPDVIFQMGTAKFGVRNDDSSLNDAKLRELAGHDRIKMIEIKFSQGAKPGKGGLLPAAKVTPEIAAIRGVPVGKSVFSPPRHMECDTTPNTVKFIRRVQEVSGLPVGIKFCLGQPAEFENLVKEMKSQNVFPDYINVDGSEVGTGAAPAAFLDHVGMPLYPAFNSVVRTLKLESVRDRLKLVCSGKLISPASHIRAFAHGADAVYSARGFMLAIGCIQALQCNTDLCPVGITTHNKTLQRGLVIEEKAQRVVNYANNLEHTLLDLLAATGMRTFHDLTTEFLFHPEFAETHV